MAWGLFFGIRPPNASSPLKTRSDTPLHMLRRARNICATKGGVEGSRGYGEETSLAENRCQTGPGLKMRIARENLTAMLAVGSLTSRTLHPFSTPPQAYVAPNLSNFSSSLLLL